MKSRWLVILGMVFLCGSTQMQGMESKLQGTVDDMRANWLLLKDMHFNTSSSIGCIVPVVNKRLVARFRSTGSGCIFDAFPERSPILFTSTADGAGSDDTSTSELLVSLKELGADIVDMAAAGGKRTSMKGVFRDEEQLTLLQKISRRMDNLVLTPSVIYCLKQALLHKDMMTGDYFRPTQSMGERALRYSSDQFILMMRLLQSWNRDFRLDKTIRGVFDKFPKDVQTFLRKLSKQLFSDEEYLMNKINDFWDVWSGVYAYDFDSDGRPLHFGNHVSAVHFGENTAGCDLWWDMLWRGEETPKHFNRLERRFPRHSFLEYLPLFTEKEEGEKPEEQEKREAMAAALGAAEFEDGGRYSKGQAKDGPAFIQSMSIDDVPANDRCPTLRRNGNTIVAFMKRPTLQDVMRLLLAILADFTRHYVRLSHENTPEANAYRDAVRSAQTVIGDEAHYFGTAEGKSVYAAGVGIMQRDPVAKAPDDATDVERHNAVIFHRRVAIRAAATKAQILETLQTSLATEGDDDAEHTVGTYTTSIESPDALQRPDLQYKAEAVAPPASEASSASASPRSASPASSPRAATGSGLGVLQEDTLARGELGMMMADGQILLARAAAKYAKHEGALYRWYQSVWAKDVSGKWEAVGDDDGPPKANLDRYVGVNSV